MAWVARLLVVALIALVAVWSVAHVGGATAMSLEMAAASSSPAMDMPGCPDCGAGKMDGRAGPSCDSICSAPVLADLVLLPEITAALMDLPLRVPAHVPVGRSHRPDPHPPRSFSLI